MNIIKVKSIFELHRNPSEAIKMKKYMRGQFEYLGIKSALRRELLIKLLKESEFKTSSVEDIIPLIYSLWNEECREYQYIALELLDQKIKNAKAGMLEHLEFFIVTKPWWDTVDFLATHQVGTLLRIYPGLIKEIVPNWLQSENIWLNRTVLLFQLKYRAKLDEALLFEGIHYLKHSKEFFIQKAIGWALREYSKTNPVSVSKFVKENDLASLSKREALRRILRK